MLTLITSAIAVGLIALPVAGTEIETESVIVQGASFQTAAQAVEDVGGTVVHDLGIIRAASAQLTIAQIRALETSGTGLKIHVNGSATLAGGSSKGGKTGGAAGSTYYPGLIGADRLHAEGITGSGVTVAVLDSGLWPDSDVLLKSTGGVRFLGSYDVLTGNINGASDVYGHGTHVAGIAVSSRSGQGRFDGVAPDADLVVVRAFDENGRGSYAEVIAGLQWILNHKETYGIRVANLSFSAEPKSYYWDDPINQAVMELWRSGIVVVASAGNRGPGAMTIGVPGNVPYVITVGAMTDNFTSEDPGDDILASFSSAGPTVEGFVKPDLVAPGGHARALMDKQSTIASEHPEFHDGSYYFQMSGTSQAAAMVTGTVALMLEQSPQLTPDEVKFRLMSTARPASFSGGSPVYSVFQQGAGLIDAHGAVHSTATRSASGGMDINLDLSGTQHYRGPADAYAAKGKKGEFVFFLRDANRNPVEDAGYLWNDKYVFEDGFMWNDGYLWNDGFMWNDGYLWNDGFMWNDGYLWNDGFMWNDLATETLFTESWIDDE